MKQTFYLFLAMTVLLLGACQPSSNENNEDLSTTEKTNPAVDAKSEVLPPAAFMEKLATADGGQLIDVRTAGEVAEGAVEGAKNLNFYEDNFKDELNKLDKDKALFLYCKSGGRSGKAAEMAKELGFKEIYDMKGGYDQYAAENK